MYQRTDVAMMLAWVFAAEELGRAVSRRDRGGSMCRTMYAGLYVLPTDPEFQRERATGIEPA